MLRSGKETTSTLDLLLLSANVIDRSLWSTHFVLQSLFVCGQLDVLGYLEVLWHTSLPWPQKYILAMRRPGVNQVGSN